MNQCKSYVNNWESINLTYSDRGGVMWPVKICFVGLCKVTHRIHNDSHKYVHPPKINATLWESIHISQIIADHHESLWVTHELLTIIVNDHKSVTNHLRMSAQSLTNPLLGISCKSVANHSWISYESLKNQSQIGMNQLQIVCKSVTNCYKSL